MIDSSFLAHADAKNIFEFLQMLGKNVVLADGAQSEFKTDGELAPLKEPESFDGSVVFFMDEADHCRTHALRVPSKSIPSRTTCRPSSL